IEALTEVSSLDVDAIAAALARTGALLVKRQQPAPSVATSLAEARAVFMTEAREVIDEALGLVPALIDGDLGARARLSRLFHRLKGSALVVEDGALSAQAAALHEALEASPEAARETPDQLADKIAGLAVQLGRPDPSGGAQRVPVPVPDRE